MKFLCVPCDQQMKLERTLPPDNSAISAVFTCPSCGASFAMHTNSMETQLVRSLGVRVGGPAPETGPMQSVRGSLTGARTLEAPTEEPASRPSDSGSGKCPFPGMVEEAYQASGTSTSGPVWTEAASARLERVPSFVRQMVKKGIEDVARQKGYVEIDEAVMAEVRAELGM